MKTGYRPDPTAVHPSIGAICCHELPQGPTDIPRHISILPSQWPARGGFLGDQFDAFLCADPAERLTDVARTGLGAADASAAGRPRRAGRELCTRPASLGGAQRHADTVRTKRGG